MNHYNESVDDMDSTKGTSASGTDSTAMNSSATKKKKNSSSEVSKKKRVVDDILDHEEEEEGERLRVIKRAYNRDCARKARQRGKDIIVQLEQKVKDLQEDKMELRRAVSAMETQVKNLQRENQSIIEEQRLKTTYDSMIADETKSIHNARAMLLAQQQTQFPSMAAPSNYFTNLPTSTSSLDAAALSFMRYNNHFY